MKYRGLLIVELVVCGLFLGCSKTKSVNETAVAPLDPIPASLVAKYLLPHEPEGGEDVMKVRESAENDQEIVVVGRIGGDSNPWVEGRAAFWIVDRSLKACSDIPGDKCPKPWDYCCQTDKLPGAIALVKVVDEDGVLLEHDARKLLAVRELSTVVVRGTAKRDEEGNLTVLASGVHVRE